MNKFVCAILRCISLLLCVLCCYRYNAFRMYVPTYWELCNYFVIVMYFSVLKYLQDGLKVSHHVFVTTSSNVDWLFKIFSLWQPAVHLQSSEHEISHLTWNTSLYTSLWNINIRMNYRCAKFMVIWKVLIAVGHTFPAHLQNGRGVSTKRSLIKLKLFRSSNGIVCNNLSVSLSPTVSVQYCCCYGTSSASLVSLLQMHVERLSVTAP